MAEMKEFASLYYREGALDPKTMQLVRWPPWRRPAARPECPDASRLRSKPEPPTTS